MRWKEGSAMTMDDDHPRKTDYDFSKEPLDRLSVDELADRIDQLRLEISRCEQEIAAKNSTRMAAEGFFKK